MNKRDWYTSKIFIGAWTLRTWLVFVVSITMLLAAIRYILPEASSDQRRELNTSGEPLVRDKDGQTLVSRVIDGDSLELRGPGGTITVRLDGIDCPELDQRFGATAALWIKETLQGRPVRIEDHGKDKYGRSLVYLYSDNDKSINHQLVEVGLAWQYREYSNDPVLNQLERSAKERGLGLWSEASPIPPWEHRSRRH